MGGKNAFGTKFSIGGTDVAELTNIGGVSMSKDTIDATSHDSEDGFREFLGGLKDGGEVSLEGNFINETGQAALVTNFNGDTAAVCVITFPVTPAITWTFDGLVTSFETSAPMEGQLGFSATIKVSGKPVLATAGA